MQAARGASLTPDPEVPDGGAVDAPAPRRRRLLLAVATVALVVDVVTKVLVVAQLEGQRQVDLGQLVLRVSRNPGAAFSFAQDSTVVFTVFALLVVAVVLRFSGRVRDRGWALALGLLLGGATGNLVDRVFRSPGVGRGAVVDFIDFQVYPSFNVADSAIVVGGLLAVLLSFRGRELDGRRTR